MVVDSYLGAGLSQYFGDMCLNGDTERRGDMVLETHERKPSMNYCIRTCKLCVKRESVGGRTAAASWKAAAVITLPALMTSGDVRMASD